MVVSQVRYGLVPLLGALALIVSCREASGAGFQVSEQSVVGMGRAFAGAGIVGDDVSAVFYNPAAMSLLDGTQVQGGLTFILPRAVLRGTSTRVPTSLVTGMPAGTPTVEPGRGGGGADTQVPQFYAVTDVIDGLKVGIAGTVPFGLLTDYDSDWIGRYHALRSILRTIDLNPSVSYRVNEYLSIGGGMSAQYASVSLSRAVFTGTPQDGLAKVSGTDWSYGYDLGVLVEANERLRAGVSFRSKVRHTFHGELRVTGVGPVTQKTDAEATTTLPETVHGDTYAQLTDRIGLSLGVRWTNWSRFDELRVRFASGAPDDVTVEAWRDTWMYKIGLDYLLLPGLVVRCGFAYDESPIRNRFFRTPRIPDAPRYWVTFGGSYHPVENLSLDFGYAHIFSNEVSSINTVPIAQPAPDTVILDRLNGNFNSQADLVGAQASWRF